MKTPSRRDVRRPLKTACSRPATDSATRIAPRSYKLGRGGARSGASMMEAVIGIALTAVMLGVGVLMLHQLMRAERHATAIVVFEWNWDRLSRTFRRDVHRAQEARLEEPPGEPAVLVLTLGDGKTTVRYSASSTAAGRDAAVLRVRETDEAPHSDRFRIPPGSEVVFARRAVAGGQENAIWRLLLNRPAAIGDHSPGRPDGKANQPVEARHQLAVDAALGRDWRFSVQE